MATNAAIKIPNISMTSSAIKRFKNACMLEKNLLKNFEVPCIKSISCSAKVMIMSRVIKSITSFNHYNILLQFKQIFVILILQMAELVKWLTRRIVAPVCMGSIPIFRPIEKINSHLEMGLRVFLYKVIKYKQENLNEYRFY